MATEDIVNRIIQEVKEKPWTMLEKRTEIVARLKHEADDITRKMFTEIQSFRPLGVMSEFSQAMGAQPRKGVRIDTPIGATIFDEKRVPSKERVERWYAEHKEAERIRTLIPEYAFSLEPRPNTVTGNYRVVEHAQRLKAQGLLTPDEEKILEALEKYWQEHPEFDRQKGYGVWGYGLDLMVPESLRKNMIEKKESLIDALLKIEPGKTIRIDSKDIPKGAERIIHLPTDTLSQPTNLDGLVLERKGDLIVVAIYADNVITAHLFLQKGSQLIQIRPIPRQKTPIKGGEATTIYYTNWVERIKKEAPEYLPEWEITTSGIRAGDTIIHRTAKYTAVVDKVYKNGNANITVLEAKEIPEWEKSIKEGFPIKMTVKGADIDRYFEKTAIKGAEAKQPWEMTYREFADLFEDVWHGQKFTFAERVGKPMGIQSQNGEPYHMIQGRRIGYGGGLPRDRWRLAIVDKAISEGKKVPEDVLAELHESLKHEKEKLGGSMAEQYEEKPPTPEVKNWMKRALGIEDYKGGRHDRIQMLALLIQNSELGNIRSISDAGSMAIDLGKDLDYGKPPAYGMSLERYYAEKIAAETGKAVPIIKSSDIIKPPVKITDVKSAFDKHFLEYNRLSLLALTQLNDEDLAHNITLEIQELSKEEALKIVPQMRLLMESRANDLYTREIKARPPAPEVPKVDFWGMVKDLKITDVKVEFAPGEPGRGYKNIYLYTYALLENGKRVRMNEEIFKGRDVAQAQKMGIEQFRQRKQYMIGETVEKNVRESSFLFLNRYEEYVKQAPVAVQKRFEEPGAVSGGTPARQILTVTQPEEYYFGTQIEVMQGADPGLEPYFTGTVKRLLNNGELVEVHPEGDPREVSFRVPVDRVNVTRLVTQEAAKKLYRYYYSHRPPGIGTQPGGFINHEPWLPARTAPHGRTAFGWVEYDRPLSPEEISGYELFEDEPELPKLVRELVQFAKDEGIDEAMKAIDAEYGRAVWDWLKSQKRIRAGAGQKEQVRDEIMRLAGITAAPPEKSQIVIESPFGIDLSKSIVPYPEINTEELNRKFGALIEKAKSMWSIRDIQGWIDRYNDPRRSREDTIQDLKGLIQTMELRQPAIEARYNAYIKSTMLTEGALASPKFLNDVKMAQDIERNIQVSIDEARSLVPQFRAIAERKINKEEIESIKELFGIDLEQEAHNLGIDLAEYAIIKAGNRVILQHKTIVQRRYEIKQPAAFTKKQPVQTVEEIKRQVVESIQAARTVEELQPILKGIGFLPLQEQDRQQVIRLYQDRFSALMAEKPFGAPVKTGEETSRVLGAPSPQERAEEMQRKKVTSAFRGQQKLTSGASVTKRLSEFGIKERMLPEMTSSMRDYIQGAVAVKDVMHHYRDGRAPIRGVMFRARDNTYFVEAQDGKFYASMGWEDVTAQGVRESAASYAAARGY